MGQDCLTELAIVDSMLDGRGVEPFDVLEVLQDIQGRFGFLPETALRRVSEKLHVPLIEVFRLANFYKAFSLKPRGRHLITACLGTACHVRGGLRVVDEVTRELGIAPGETTSDGAFTLETVNCLGACALAPIVIIDGRYYDHMSPEKLRNLLQRLRSAEEEEEEIGVGADRLAVMESV
ncbi:MAG: NAD(P)H-dependent oxidoreductase subunit E [Thermoleophilia bacterium]|nr:NAD(P)H-dependent oxidoreductase subunit E [Thermoleophilia bacterium]